MALTAKQKREAREQRLREEGAAQARKEMANAAPAPVAGPTSEEILALNEAAFRNPGAVPDAKGRIAKPQHAGAKVIVACKLGVAYYDIQLSRIVDKFEQNMQGGRMVKEAIRIGDVVRLRGTAYPRGTPPEGFPDRPEMVNGASLTRGVDKDWMEEWMRQHERDPIVINKMIFVAETMDAITGESAELSKFLSGLEPVNPKGDKRISKSTRPEVEDVAPGQRPKVGA